MGMFGLESFWTATVSAQIRAGRYAARAVSGDREAAPTQEFVVSGPERVRVDLACGEESSVRADAGSKHTGN